MKKFNLLVLVLLLSYASFGVLPITGTTTICQTSCTTLSDATPGGTWSSGNVAVGTIDPVSGMVCGLFAGTAIITYDVSGVFAVTQITVLPRPNVITGSFTMCAGVPDPLGDATMGGNWTSSNVSIVTIGGVSGVAVGVTAGVSMITYNVAGCYALQTVTVYTSPTPITGPPAVCLGGTGTLTDLTSGGSWTSSDMLVASIGDVSGVVTGVSLGTAEITYSLSSSCSTTFAVSVVPTPTAYTVTGGGSYCSGGTGVSIGLSGSEISTTYYLYNGGSLAGTASGSGAAINFGSFTAGIYSVSATNSSGCSTPASGSAIVTILAAPTSYPVTGGGSYCSGGTGVAIGLSASQTSTTYYLYNGGSLAGTLSGTGAAINFGNFTAAGTYTVSATNTAGCSAPASGSAVVTINALPISYSVTGGGPYCSGGSGVTIGLSGSQTSTTYYLYDGGTLMSTMSGTGSAFNFGVYTTAGTYSVTSTNTSGCSGTSLSTTTVSINPLPNIYSISSGGSYCAGGTGVDVSLGGSDAGISYQLYLGGTATGLPLVSSGGALDFGLHTAAGAYTIVATNTVTGCTSNMTGSAVITITPTVTPAVSVTTTGGTSVCAGTTDTYTAIPVNGGSLPVYQWQLNGVNVGSGSASYTYVPLAADIISVRMTSSATCPLPATASSSVTMTVISAITVAASATAAACGGGYTLSAAGASSYSWSPSAGLSCATCASTSAVVSGTTVFTVIGDSYGCLDTSSVTVPGNRITGSVSFSGSTPDSLDMLVWLIQFNTSDSSIQALDSTNTCLSGGMPYYEFDNPAIGNYLVKGKLLHGNPPGASGYLPTYGASSSFWYDGSTVTHSSGSDNLNIDMIYGTVPFGPGFISGFVTSGAGRGTSGDIPAAGMLVYLRDAGTNRILTFTYTDNTGAFTFSNLANSSYIIYPENFDDYTTPSSVITLNSSMEMATNINFKQHTNSRTITPLAQNSVATVTGNELMKVYPNPTNGAFNIQWNNQQTGNAGVVVTDIMGREVYKTSFNMATPGGIESVDPGELKEGNYFLSITTGSGNYISELQILK